METLDLTKKEVSIFMDDINVLDFTMIKLKLQDKEEGLGWEEPLCNEVELEYRRFLALKRKYPHKEVVPSQLVDKFWHQHILDTQKYAEDCDVIFGFFLHHFPYFGMRGQQDYENLCNAFEETKDIYSLHFEGTYDGASSRCRTGCKPVKCK